VVAVAVVVVVAAWASFGWVWGSMAAEKRQAA
jgi:hypothetical protein